MRVLIIDNGTKHLGRLKDLLFGNEVNVASFFTKTNDTQKYDLVVMSGGSVLSVESAPEAFKEEFDMVLNSQKPIVGICEGCQIIAKAYGSKLHYYDKKAKGLKTIHVIGNNTIFAGVKSFEAYEAHHFAVTDLGKELTVLAKSKYGCEVIKHKTKKIYGLQFHPEMLVDESFGDDLFRRIVNQLTK